MTSTTSRDSAASVSGRMSQTWRVLLPWPRTLRRMLSGAITRVAWRPVAGAALKATSAGLRAVMRRLWPGGTYTAVGALSSNTLARLPRALNAWLPTCTSTWPVSTVMQYSSGPVDSASTSPACSLRALKWMCFQPALAGVMSVTMRPGAALTSRLMPQLLR